MAVGIEINQVSVEDLGALKAKFLDNFEDEADEGFDLDWLTPAHAQRMMFHYHALKSGDYYHEKVQDAKRDAAKLVKFMKLASQYKHRMLVDSDDVDPGDESVLLQRIPPEQLEPAIEASTAILRSLMTNTAPSIWGEAERSCKEPPKKKKASKKKLSPEEKQKRADVKAINLFADLVDVQRQSVLEQDLASPQIMPRADQLATAASLVSYVTKVFSAYPGDKISPKQPGSKWSFFRPFFSSAALLKPPPGERHASKEGSIPSSSHHITCGPAPRAISFTVSEIHDITV